MSDKDVKEQVDTQCNPNIQDEMENRNTVSTQETKEGKPTKKKSTYIIIGILVIIVILLAVVIYMLLNKKDIDEGDNRDTVVTKENLDEMKERLSQPVKDGYYKTSMTIDWNFDNAKAVSRDAFVENVETNTRTVYFDVNLTSTNELVYTSPYIPRGEYLNEITLEKELPPGDHPAVVTYHLVDDEHKVVSNLAVAITIHILS